VLIKIKKGSVYCCSATLVLRVAIDFTLDLMLLKSIIEHDWTMTGHVILHVRFIFSYLTWLGMFS